MTAKDAAAELNVSRSTVYAYVSRGLIRSEASGGSRARLYHADDVRRLRQRKLPGPVPDGQANNALSYGAPVLDSAITLIADGRLFYRGRDVAALARSAELETVAQLMWQCENENPFAGNMAPQVPIPSELSEIERCQAMLAHGAAKDLPAYNLSPSGVAQTAARIVRLVASAFAGQKPGPEPLHEVLAQAWAQPAAADAIRMALVLSADHELNVSAFTVRCVASARATPYAAVTAGMAAMQGPRHGGQSARVAALLAEAEQSEQVTSAVRQRLKRGDPFPGFGHPLYPDGDVRAAILMDYLTAHQADSTALARIRSMADCIHDLVGHRPNIDFALSALTQVYALPAGAALAVFAVGRTVGWLAHAQEQYQRPELIRPRARYTGDHPQPAHAFAAPT